MTSGRLGVAKCVSATCLVWPAQAYCNTLEAATLAHIGNGVTAMTDRTATSRHPAGIRAFVGRRPVTAFLIMAFAIAYPIMSLPALAVHRVIPGGQLHDRLPFPPDEIAGLMLTMFALLPSALFVTWAA